MNYEVRENEKFGSKEIYFDAKPSEGVRNALKTLHFRWNRVKSCWYGFADQGEIIKAILENESVSLGGIVSDGYLGAVKWEGLKSNERLYGSSLSAAIRAEFKRQNINGVSVRCKTFSGGQEITITVKTSSNDYVPFEDYYKSFGYGDLPYWVTINGESIHRDSFISLCDGEGYDEYMPSAARSCYNAECGNVDVNYYHIDKYKAFSNSFKQKLHLINLVLDTFHYDDSNSQVDYFNTNFYRSVTINPAV